MRKRISLLVLFLLVSLSTVQIFQIVFAVYVINPGGGGGSIFDIFNSISSSEIDDFLETLENLGRVAELGAEQIAPYIFELSDKGLSQLSAEQLEYEDSSGIRTINKIDDWNKLNRNARDEALSEITGKYISTDGIVNGEVVGNGIRFDSIKFLQIDDTSVINGAYADYDGVRLKVKSADSVLADSNDFDNVQDFEGYADSYSVGSANSFLSGCVRANSIKDSSIKAGNRVEITKKSNASLKITDCSYNEAEFTGKGKVSVDKSQNPSYVVENGILEKKGYMYSEKVEVQNSAIIEMDRDFGFKCLTFTSPGSYFYNDMDLRRDFVINIPKESPVYKLCLRKHPTQLFNDYNGLADFVDKRIELNGIASYLRYPFKNNEVSGLLSSFVYRGLSGAGAILSYDSNLIFLDNIFIINKNNINADTLSITYPSNYYTIKEVQVGNEMHSIVQLNLNLKKKDLEQNINYEYKTGYFEPKAAIRDNVLLQENGNGRLVILPPEHEMIGKMLSDIRKV